MFALRRRPTLVISIVFVFWTLVGLLYFGHELMVYSEADGRLPTPRLLAVHAVEWWSWAIMTPLIYLLVRRFPFGSTSWPRLIVIYGAAAIVALLLNAAIVACGWWSFPWNDLSFGQVFATQLQRLISYDTLLFIWVALAMHALLYHDTARQRTIEAAQLQSQLADARLNVLTMQLQPHFLFNTLNTISGLVLLEPRRAERMISRLADLLRVSLRRDRGALVPLAEEIEFLGKYLEIQETRFDERLAVDIDVDPNAMSILVPAFLLQPLVENTLRHAVAPYSAPVRIAISAQRVEDRLRIVVRDDGPGLPVEDPAQLAEGVGLRNTRVRLQQLYGAHHRFDIHSHPEGGVQVLMDLPWEHVGSAEAARANAATVT